jgi:hypothetical protein
MANQHQQRHQLPAQADQAPGQRLLHLDPSRWSLHSRSCWCMLCAAP